MTAAGGFVDPLDPPAVEQVLATSVRGLGLERTLANLASVPGLGQRAARGGGLFRAAEPALVWCGDRVLRFDQHGQGVLDHVVGGIILASDPVAPPAVPGVLASLVVRAVQATGGADDVAVLLTALRDALGAGS